MTGVASSISGLEPGSFRDPDSRIFTADGRVLRLLSERGLADWRALSSSGLLKELDAKVVGTREVEAVVPEALHGGVAAVLEHDRIPFVSYPYEWTFSMLRDAALLQLELLRRAIEKGLILANVRGLERLIGRLRWEPDRSTWSEYGPHTTYTAEDAERKARFVADAVAEERPRLVWDLGCNEGRHSRIAAESVEHVVAMDADSLVVDRLYRALRDEGETRILPLAVNIVDPPPGLGWRGEERRPLLDRGRPELTLALALIHHVSIAGNVPVAEFLDWLRGATRSLVIEFVSPEDPMARRLLARKQPGNHPDYRADWFEQCLAERFDVLRSEQLAGGTRTLYLARAKA